MIVSRGFNMRSIARWAAAGLLTASVLATPAQANLTFLDVERGGASPSPSPVPVADTTGGDLVTVEPVPKPSGFVWTVSGAGLVWFDETVTSAPGGPGGTVVVKRSDGGLFQFNSVEYALNSLDPSIPLFSLLVQGFVGGGVVDSATFHPTALGSYAAFGPGGLAGTDVDELRFGLSGARLSFDEEGFPVRHELSMSIRRLALVDNATTAPIPEPGSWTLMIVGFGLAGAAVRRRRSAFA